MTKILAYLAPIVVLLAAMIGLLGESRVAGVSGLQGLTALGWTAAGLATASTAIALVFVFKSHSDLDKALLNQQRIHAAAHSNIQKGVDHLKDVLKFACLMRYTVSPYHAGKEPRDIPYESVESGGALLGYKVDFRSDDALEDLSVVYLHPSMKLRGPYVPSVVPFGADIVRPAMTILADESSAAKEMIEGSLQMGAASSLSPDVFEAASMLLGSSFLSYLMGLNQAWHRRYKMEGDCDVPEITLVSVVGSGIRGGSKADYLRLLDAMESLEKAVGQSESPKSRPVG